MSAHPAIRRFAGTADGHVADDWSHLLELQVDVTLADELALFQSTPEWLGARSVIDAGCGNGYFISRLNSWFPDKRYVGVDSSPELIAIARAAQPHRTFVNGDFFSAELERADAVLMRLVFQQVCDFSAVLRRAAELLLPGGSLILIDSDLGRSQLLPRPPTFLAMLDEYHRANAAAGSIRARLLADPEELLRSTGEPWRVVASHEAVTASAGPFAGSKLLGVFGHWADLAARSGQFAFDFDAVKRELAVWGSDATACARIAMRMVVLTPKQH